MSFFILVGGKLNHHSFSYLTAEGKRLEPTLVPHERPPRLPPSAYKTWVLELMSRSLITLPPDSSVSEAIALFKQKHIHHIPIVESGKLIGLISDRDVMWLQQIYADKTAILERFMNKIVVACHEETPIDHLAKVFYQEGINGMPVVNDQQQLVGMITHHDLLRWIFEGKSKS